FVFAPVADAVCQQPAIIRNVEQAHGFRAVAAELVRVDQNDVVAGTALLQADHGQIAAGLLLAEEIPGAARDRHADAVDLHQFAQTPGDCLASRESSQQAFGVFILPIDPRARGGTLLIFEPAITVDDLDAMNDLLDGFHIGLRSRSVLSGSCLRGSCTTDQQQRNGQAKSAHAPHPFEGGALAAAPAGGAAGETAVNGSAGADGDWPSILTVAWAVCRSPGVSGSVASSVAGRPCFSSENATSSVLKIL